MDLNDEIAKVAYELFERDGRRHGKDREHWCEAEEIVRARHAAAEKKAETPKAKPVPAPQKAVTAKPPQKAVTGKPPGARRKRPRRKVRPSPSRARAKKPGVKEGQVTSRPQDRHAKGNERGLTASFVSPFRLKRWAAL